MDPVGCGIMEPGDVFSLPISIPCEAGCERRGAVFIVV